MDYELIIRPEARMNLLGTFQWYQEQRSGFDFKLCVDEVLSKLQRHLQFIKKHIKIFEELLREDFRSACFILLNIIMQLFLLSYTQGENQKNGKVEYNKLADDNFCSTK